MLVGTEAEVLDGLTGVLGATEDQGVATGRRAESKLIQSDGLTTSSDDASTSSGGETKSGDGHLGVGLGGRGIIKKKNNDDGALLALAVDVGNNARQGDGRAVDLGGEETTENNLVEGSVGTTYRILVSIFSGSERSRLFGKDVRARKR